MRLVLFNPSQENLEEFKVRVEAWGNQLAEVIDSTSPRRCTIPPGALIKANPGLFLAVPETLDKIDYHAYFEKKETLLGRKAYEPINRN